jgi:hypothetical protein
LTFAAPLAEFWDMHLISLPAPAQQALEAIKAFGFWLFLFVLKLKMRRDSKFYENQRKQEHSRANLMRLGETCLCWNRVSTQ